MSSKKALPISGTLTVMVIVVVLVPSALLDQTAEFEAAFMKKCVEYPKDKNSCEDTLAIFEEAYVRKKDSAVTADSYNKLFDKTLFEHPCGKTMFYSGINREKTNDVVHRFTKKTGSYFTLEDTLLGHVLDGLIWYGKEGSEETFTSDSSTNKPNAVNPFWPNAVDSFWIMASIRFAQYACDDVTAMLNGDQDQPYDENRYFAKYEFPNLRSTEVKRLIVILVVNKENKRDYLTNLKNMLEKNKNFDHIIKEVTLDHIEDCIDKNTKDCF